LAPRLSPASHTHTPAIAATFTNIAARVVRESNCLLPLGFTASVNIRRAVSLPVTDKAMPATSYAPYFESLTRSLNQSFPVGENPWAQFILAPTTVQLAIHALLLSFIPQDEEELFPYLRRAILNDKATPILSARYLNASRDSRGTKQATSPVVVTVDPQQDAALTSGVIILTQKPKLELALSASRSAQCRNCWRYGHATQRCPATHQTCRICALYHTPGAYRCENPTCGRSGINKPVPSCCPTSPPPLAATAVMTTLPPSKSVRVDLDLLSPPEIPPQNPRGKTPWRWPSMATRRPLLPWMGRVLVKWTS